MLIKHTIPFHTGRLPTQYTCTWMMPAYMHVQFNCGNDSGVDVLARHCKNTAHLRMCIMSGLAQLGNITICDLAYQQLLLLGAQLEHD
jgi:hypothetical protein